MRAAEREIELQKQRVNEDRERLKAAHFSLSKSLKEEQQGAEQQSYFNSSVGVVSISKASTDNSSNFSFPQADLAAKVPTWPSGKTPPWPEKAMPSQQSQNAPLLEFQQQMMPSQVPATPSQPQPQQMAQTSQPQPIQQSQQQQQPQPLPPQQPPPVLQ